MKNVYEELKLSIVLLDTVDIICSSSEGNDDTKYDVGGQWNQNWFN